MYACKDYFPLKPADFQYAKPAWWQLEKDPRPAAVNDKFISCQGPLFFAIFGC